MTEYSEKNILAIDTSSNYLILGLCYDGDRLVKSQESVEKSHGQFIIKKISELFQSAGIKINELDAIVVSTGPGSFTGLRIGIAAAKGMAVALKIVVVGVNLFEIAAYKLRQQDEKVSIIIPLKKDEFYVTNVYQGKYDSDNIKIVSDNNLLKAVNGLPLAGFGINLTERFPGVKNKIITDQIRYDASEYIYLGVDKLLSGENVDLPLLEPLYLQKSQAEINFELRNRK